MVEFSEDYTYDYGDDESARIRRRSLGRRPRSHGRVRCESWHASIADCNNRSVLWRRHWSRQGFASTDDRGARRRTGTLLDGCATWLDRVTCRPEQPAAQQRLTGDGEGDVASSATNPSRPGRRTDRRSGAQAKDRVGGEQELDQADQRHTSRRQHRRPRRTPAAWPQKMPAVMRNDDAMMTRVGRSPTVTTPTSVMPALPARARAYSSSASASPGDDAEPARRAQQPERRRGRRRRTPGRPTSRRRKPHPEVRDVSTATAPSRLSRPALTATTSPASDRPPRSDDGEARHQPRDHQAEGRQHRRG